VGQANFQCLSAGPQPALADAREGLAVLVLTRRVNESIVIGNDVTITVISVQGHGAHAQVRLGITAPRETAVLRREVYDAVRAENERALQPPPAESKQPTS
jgi:carbon storage regulator